MYLSTKAGTIMSSIQLRTSSRTRCFLVFLSHFLERAVSSIATLRSLLYSSTVRLPLLSKCLDNLSNQFHPRLPGLMESLCEFLRYRPAAKPYQQQPISPELSFQPLDATLPLQARLVIFGLAKTDRVSTERILRFPLEISYLLLRRNPDFIPLPSPKQQIPTP